MTSRFAIAPNEPPAFALFRMPAPIVSKLSYIYAIVHSIRFGIML